MWAEFHHPLTIYNNFDKNYVFKSEKPNKKNYQIDLSVGKYGHMKSNRYKKSFHSVICFLMFKVLEKIEIRHNTLTTYTNLKWLQ